MSNQNDEMFKVVENDPFAAPLNSASTVKHVIGIVSGKGGVGKSLVTSLLASTMRKKGKNVAILDADITGPSIPKAFGVKGDVKQSALGIFPPKSKEGIEIMSINLLLENETEPVVWRGPIIAGTVKQFWTEVVWGDIDYMFVDMPPGTGDVPLTVFQSLPVEGIVIVSSPQELVSMIVSKAVNMAKMMNIPVLGVIENMSSFECDECHKQHQLFGESHIESLLASYDIKLLAKLPIVPAIAAACDHGEIESIEREEINQAVKILLQQ